MNVVRANVISVLLASTAISLAAPAPLLAQEAGGGAQLEEVIVTAQKRAERLEDVPISISAMTGPALERAGITNVQDVAMMSVGVNINHQASFVQPAIRGVSSTTTTGTLANNVAVYVDGFYQPTTTGLNQDLLNIASVSVLKGPQGTLFGRNATGGAILVETLEPSLTGFSGRARVGYGRFDEKIGQLYVTGPIVGDRLGFDLSAYRRVSDGYIKDIGGKIADGEVAPIKILSLRGKLLWRPTDSLKATLAIDHSDVRDPSNLTKQIVDKNLVAAEVPGAFYASAPWRTSMTFPQEMRDTQTNYGVTVEYDMGWATLKSLSAFHNEHIWVRQDTDGTIIDRQGNASLNVYNMVTQELNLGHSGERLDWVTGVFAMKLLNRVGGIASGWAPGTPRSAQTYTPGPTPDVQTKGRLDAFAVFADGTYRITDRLALIAGLRYSYEHHLINIPRPLSSATPTATNYLPNPSISTSFNSVTPRAVLRYEVAADTNVYASYAKGFKGGGYIASVPRNTANQPGNYPLRPEKNTAYEIGFKTAQRTWRLSAAAFYMDYKDLQFTAFAQASGGGLAIGAAAPFSRNAASAKIKGFEIEGSWNPIENLSLTGGVGYTHARYKTFDTSVGWSLCPLVVPGSPTICNDRTFNNAVIPAGYNTGSQINNDVSGKQMLRAPDWTWNAGFQYTVPSDAGDVVISGQASYTGRHAGADLSLVKGTNDYRYTQPAYTLFNGQIAWTPFNKDFTITVWGRNLSNEVVYAYQTGTSLGDQLAWSAPRTYGVRLDYEF